MRSYNSTRYFAAAVLFAAIAFSQIGYAQHKGHLVIIGGGERTDEIMKKFIELAGGKDATVVVFPMASTVSEEVGIEQAEQIKKFGVKESFYLNINADAANQDSTVAKLAKVTGIFYSGGDQVLLTAALLNTKVQDRIHEIYKNGGVVGGTSAGAAVMSKIMLTGNELLNKDSSGAFFSLLKGNIETKEGFGFVTNAVIDQHFVKRRRHNRLISVVLEHPKLIGIGIDESTSIIVNPDNTFDVLGESVVIVYDATTSQHVRTNKNNYLSAENMSLNILQSGDSYNLKTKKSRVKN